MRIASTLPEAIDALDAWHPSSGDIAQIRDILADHPDNLHVLHKAGVAFRKGGRSDEALQNFGAVIAGLPPPHIVGQR